jgi:hypothetical protein
VTSEILLYLKKQTSKQAAVTSAWPAQRTHGDQAKWLHRVKSFLFLDVQLI